MTKTDSTIGLIAAGVGVIGVVGVGAYYAFFKTPSLAPEFNDAPYPRNTSIASRDESYFGGSTRRKKHKQRKTKRK